MPSPILLSGTLFALAIASFFTVRLGKLTAQGAITGFFVAFLLFLNAGFAGISLLAVFFITASVATSFKKNLKQSIDFTGRDESARTAGQVFANGGLSAIVAGFSLLSPEYNLVASLVIAACFSSASADTISSELGTVYGSRFFNILTLRPDKRGENGVVSIEGFVFGLVGSFLIATVYSIFYGWDYRFLWIIVAGTIGNLSDSVLGATLERKNLLGNNAVNFLNTLIAALSILIFLL